MKSTNPSIQSALRAWRARRKLSQSQAAAELQMSVRTLQEWEHGRSAPKGFTRSALLGRIAPRGKS